MTMRRPHGDVAQFANGPWHPWFAWRPVRLGRDLGHGVRGAAARWVFLRWIWRRWGTGALGLATYTDYSDAPGGEK